MVTWYMCPKQPSPCLERSEANELKGTCLRQTPHFNIRMKLSSLLLFPFEYYDFHLGEEYTKEIHFISNSLLPIKDLLK
jgi:hypothetical protein